MKKIGLSIWVAVALIGLASVAGAQGPGGPGRGGPPGMGGMGGRPRMKPGEMDRNILKQVKLTPIQKKKSDALIDHMIKQYEPLMPKPGTRPSGDLRTKFRAIHTEFEGKLAKVISPAQMKQYLKLRDEMRARFRGGPGGGRGGPGGFGGRGGPGGPGGPGRGGPGRPGG